MKIRFGKDSHDRTRLIFYCPACKYAHSIPIDGIGHWDYNGNSEKPSLTPSIAVSIENMNYLCHSFLTDGIIHFAGDSTHSLGGQSIPLVDFPEGYVTE